MGLFERRDGHVERKQGRLVLPGWIEQHGTRGSGALLVRETGETGRIVRERRPGAVFLTKRQGFEPIPKSGVHWRKSSPGDNGLRSGFSRKGLSGVSIQRSFRYGPPVLPQLGNYRSRYNRLILCMAGPADSIMHIRVETDKGAREISPDPFARDEIEILWMGFRAGADHTHEDKGSFVLEFAAQSFATDLGIRDYGDPMSNVYKQAQRHNMLAPYGTPDRPRPLRPLPVDVGPAGEGDEIRFHARIEAAPGWGDFYKQWEREWDSATPDTLVIRDEYEIGRGDGVEFYWQTLLLCRLEGQTVTITGDKGIVTVTAPEGTSVRLEEPPLHGAATQQCIAIRKEGVSGTLEVRVKLMPKAQ